jgi:hypothetical protein
MAHRQLPAAVQDAFAVAEHIYMGSEEPAAAAAAPAAAETVERRVELRNRLRGASTRLTLFAEGFLEVAERRNGRSGNKFRLDLRYLDPVPTIERVIASRALLAALCCAAAAGLAAWLATFDALRGVALSALLVAAPAAVVALAIAAYRSHEKTQFLTIHGRAPVLSLVANVGSIRTFHAFVPVLCHAIEEAAERIGDDTAAYLRAEMREHYRLRGEGVLDNGSCADSTGRILAQFDMQL